MGLRIVEKLCWRDQRFASTLSIARTPGRGRHFPEETALAALPRERAGKPVS